MKFTPLFLMGKYGLLRNYGKTLFHVALIDRHYACIRDKINMLNGFDDGLLRIVTILRGIIVNEELLQIIFVKGPVVLM